MAKQLGVRTVTTTALHPQTEGCVERLNRVLAQAFACLASTTQDEWDNYVVLACFRYNSGISKLRGVTPYEVVFGVQPFMDWGEAELNRVAGESYNLKAYRPELQELLLTQEKVSRSMTARQYDTNVMEVSFKEQDSVFAWCLDLVRARKKQTGTALDWAVRYRKAFVRDIIFSSL